MRWSVTRTWTSAVALMLLASSSQPPLAGGTSIAATAGSASAPSAQHAISGSSFREDDSVRIAAAGDIACGLASFLASCRHMDTSNLLLGLDPDAVLALGDLQYETGSYAEFLSSWEPSWGRLKDRVHPAVGNHEYGTAGASGYFAYFNGLGATSGPAGATGQGYYSFDLGGWHLVALNSNCAEVGGCEAGSAQERWLRADLASHPTACSLMFMHHPLWSSDAREFRLLELRPLVQAFYEAGGELLLVGHSHFYERFAPQDPDGNTDLARGVREIVVGTGGRNVYGFGPVSDNSEVRGARTFGVLLLTLDATSYRWEFVPVAGQDFTDSGWQVCH